MSTSMVKGNPLKLMLHFALPLLIGNLLQQTYNIIDAASVGQILGAKALASVGQQQRAVSGFRLLHGKLYGLRCTGGQIFWRQQSGKNERLHI